MPSRIKAARILTNGVLNSTGEIRTTSKEKLTFQAVGSTSSGAGTATVLIEGSLDGVNYDLLGTLTLSWTNPATGSDSVAINAAWPRVRFRVTAITGTGAQIQGRMAGGQQ